MDYTILDTTPGGIGKNVMATAVINGLKNKEPEKPIVVVSPYPEIFLHNPNVYRVFRSGATPYFWEDYIKGRNSTIFKQDPYNETSHIYGKTHLVETWSKLCGVESIFNMSLHLTPREIENFINKYKFDWEKTVIFQPFGGGELSSDYDWARDIPKIEAQQIVNILGSMGYTIIHIKNDKNAKLDGVVEITNLPMRELIGLIMLSKHRILIDSCGQHIAAALNLPSTVCWVANKPEVFGYSIHDNIVAAVDSGFRHEIDGYLQKYDWTGQLHHQFPFDSQNLFDISRVIQKFIS